MKMKRSRFIDKKERSFYVQEEYGPRRSFYPKPLWHHHDGCRVRWLGKVDHIHPRIPLYYFRPARLLRDLRDLSVDGCAKEMKIFQFSIVLTSYQSIMGLRH